MATELVIHNFGFFKSSEGRHIDARITEWVSPAFAIFQVTTQTYGWEEYATDKLVEVVDKFMTDNPLYRVQSITPTYISLIKEIAHVR